VLEDQLRRRGDGAPCISTPAPFGQGLDAQIPGDLGEGFDGDIANDAAIDNLSYHLAAPGPVQAARSIVLRGNDAHFAEALVDESLWRAV